jgi:hypothetical protein
MTVAQPAHTWSSQGAHRFGYAVAIAVNAAMLYVAQNLLTWNLFSWVTEAWEDVLPIVSFSLLFSILVNLIYLAYDQPWFKALTQAIVGGIGLMVTIRIYQVFPFDFSAYAFDWTVVAKAALILAMVGTTIGMIVEAAKFIRALSRPATDRPT